MTTGSSDSSAATTERTGTLLQKTAGGAGWTISWRVVTRTLGFLSTLVLARLLTPADFGLVALAMNFSRAIDVFADLGVQDALIRAGSSTRHTYDAAFTVNAIRGLITALVIAVSAGPFATAFDDPRLFYVVLVLALAVLLDTFENVGVADFRRDFAFRREFQLSIIPRLAQVAVTIGLAFTWANYWALVAGILIAKIIQTVASYIMHPYRPRFSLVGRGEIIGFSIWTWAINMGWMIKWRGIIMIIGGILNPTQVGVYTVGAEIATLPENELVGPLSRVCFASFAAAKRAGISVADTYMRVVSSTLVIAVPASIGVSAIAAPLVTLAFGAKWQEATPVVQILAISGVFAVITRISTTLLSAFGYLGPLFANVVGMSVVQFALLIPFVMYWGITGGAIACSLALFLEQINLARITFRRFSFRPLDLLSRIWRCLVASLAMAVFLAASGLGWVNNQPNFLVDLMQLLTASATGATVYTVVLLCLWFASGKPNGPEMDVLELIKRATSGIQGRISRRAAILWPAGPR